MRGRGEERNSFNDANEKENVYKSYSLIVMIVCKWYDIKRGQINTINHFVPGINNKIKGKLNKFVQTTMQLFNAIFFLEKDEGPVLDAEGRSGTASGAYCW